ncbi:MAG: PilZ domain-containing protein [Spirochaetaceae bacterium]|jgi:hypothetical protein|nr:PilZ domain-containing protein [Spirochaetaceae bacterium]GMO20740.1 MAG: hypothetical protein Pg6A_07600 [Termitinemataceae bacterium]
MNFAQFSTMMLPLQSLSEFNISSNDTLPHKIAFATGVIILVGIFIFLNVSKRVRNSKAFTKGTLGTLKEKTPIDKLYKQFVRNYSLKKDELAMLKELLKSSRGEPEETIKDRAALDMLFKDAYQRLVKEAEASQEAIAELRTLFNLRSTIFYFEDGAAAAAKGKTPRKTPRRDCNFNCACYMVILAKVKENGKKVKKLKLSGASFQGVLVDVSSNGCALKVPSVVKAGSQLKIEFNLGKRQMAALGQVIRVNKDSKGTIIHVQFIKVQPKTQFTLNAFVYNYI